MRANGATTALVSGGFTAITEIVRKKLDFDLCYGNTLVVDSSIVTGNLKPPIIDGDAKAAILDQMRKLEISRRHVSRWRRCKRYPHVDSRFRCWVQAQAGSGAT